MAEADLAALFAQCGEVLEVRLLRKDDGKSKGIAFVKFST
jgi:RNA recognition motif-containing protein